MTKPLPTDTPRRLLDYGHLAAYLGISLRAAKQLAEDVYIERIKRRSA
jgi:hypothetical protein